MVANTGTYLDSPFHRFAHATDVADLPLHSVPGLDGVVIRVGAGRRVIDRDTLAAYDVAGRAVLSADPNDTFTERPAGCGGCAEYPAGSARRSAR